jgi:hypothetical protein
MERPQGDKQVTRQGECKSILLTSLGDIEVFRSTYVEAKYFKICLMLGHHRSYTLVHACTSREQVVYVIIRLS